MLLTQYPICRRKLQTDKKLRCIRQNNWLHRETKELFSTEELVKYNTVKISHSTDGYRLHYNNDASWGTGPFKTRSEAIAWFDKGGR